MPFSTAARRVRRESSSEISPHSVPPSCQAPNPISETLTPVSSNSLFFIQRLPTVDSEQLRLPDLLPRSRSAFVLRSAFSATATKLVQSGIDQLIGLITLVH